MESWWRVLRGVKPYMASVVISMICALGVGLSYASGVAVMLPVMKVFISQEHIHGWIDRTAAEQRLDAKIWDRDATVSIGREELVVTESGRGTPAALQLTGDTKSKSSYKLISHVKAVAPTTQPTAAGPKGTLAERESSDWFDMSRILATAPAGQPIEMEVTDLKGTFHKTITVTPPPPSFYMPPILWLVHLLPEDPFQGLVYTVLFFIVLCFIGSAFRYYQQYLGMAVANRVVMDIRRRMYDRVVQLPISYFARTGTSDAMSRLTQDTNTLTDGVSMALGKAVQEPIKAVACFFLAIFINWQLCLLVVLSVPILGIIIRKFSKRMRRASRGTLENWSHMLAVINETLIGARVVKAYSGEGYERRRFARVNKKLLKEQNRLSHYSSLSRPTVETLAVILSSVPMMWAAYLVLHHQVDTTKFFTLLACFVAMLEPMRKLSDVNGKVQQTNAAAARVFEVIDMKSEPNYDQSLPKLPRHHRSVEFRDIVFSYPGHEEIVLDHVSVLVKAGQNVAVVGGNGSGKTTLLQLLPLLYAPTSGQVLIDGIDVTTVSLRSLRKQIGLVTQDTLLFADTIYNNIAYGTRHATREQVMDAARRSYADEFIRTLPEGYETRVGEHGVRLSGGQKQRIAIARAILHDPTMLILDEAMSQIDSDSETKISLALREFTRHRTVFMIAHRFQSVISADLIVVLDKGKVAGVGTHNQLIETCLPYRKLYENQFREVG
ncbi:MAG TPA: ABC transporter ATP-binding protein [Phycisphaerae bacterium]|nr:ABC transporter ATP-binding protein [Phycisphaerae bacterium]